MNFDDLKKRWSSFIGAVFSPEPLFLLGVGTILLWLSFNYKEEPRFFVLVNILAAILTGLGVAFIKGRYDEAIQESILLKKGSSAVRNLDSIGQQIVQIRGWIKLFISKKDKTRRDLEEIERHLSTTEMNIKSGIEDWVDIVEELRKRKETVNVYQDVLLSYVEKILINKKELLRTKENKDKERLKKSIKELEKSVKQLKEDRPQVFGEGFRVSGLPNSAISFGIGNDIGILSGLGEKICVRCGRRYKENIASVSMFSSNLCPNCQQGGSSILAS